MDKNIIILAFIESTDLGNSTIFQNFGNNKISHPNLVRYFEYVDSDTTGLFQAAYEDFKVKSLPTFIFTYEAQKEPQILQPIIHIEGDISNQILEDVFNQIIEDKIPIPPIGNDGLEVKSDGKSIITGGNGGLGIGFGKSKARGWLLAFFAVVAAGTVYKKRKRKR